MDGELGQDDMDKETRNGGEEDGHIEVGCDDSQMEVGGCEGQAKKGKEEMEPWFAEAVAKHPCSYDFRPEEIQQQGQTSSYSTCKQNDPDFNGCLKEALQSAAPLLKNGIPGLVVPSIDPTPFASIKIQQGKKQRPVSVDVEFDNMLVYGMSRGFVDSVEMVPGSYHMKTHLRVDDPMYMIGTYKGDGMVLVLPIKGSGAGNITICKFICLLPRAQNKPLEREGEVYWDIKNFTVKMDVGKIYIQFDNLFNGDKLLGDNMNKFLNESMDLLVEDLKPAIELALAATDMDVARRLFSKVP
ncbi:protein takeout-like [Schistocerca serialis cubense]|uniref:protein takeout-like n=1 Tax=Schistocerca serialis cubense TaxID=2023355 RepID=UPI00214DF703|nr:protein takeout-like [Schistocerca serialis cubense]